MAKERDRRIETLAGVDLFAGCSKAELRELASITTEIDAEPGAVLCREGGVGRECYVVIDGEAAVTIDGDEIDVVGPGDFFGEMALLDGGPRVATVTASTAMRLLVLSHAEFIDVLTEVPAVARKILVAVGGRLRTAHAQLHPRRIGA